MNLRLLIFLTILTAFSLSCTEYRKVLKSNDMQYKYDKALEYFKAGKLTKAYPLFDELYIVYRGTDKAERIAYYQAYCDYNLGDYRLAGHRFTQYRKNYPSSPHAARCQFMGAYCQYLLSPKYSLDQTDTKSAIKFLQIFAIQNPNSSLIDSTNQLLDDLREKLEYKDYKQSRLYHKMSDYKSAIVAFENFIKDYPNSEHLEEVHYLLLDSRYRLALNSVEEKKAERLEDAIKAYVTFADRFSESKRIRDAEELYEEIVLEKNKTLI